MPKFSSKSKRKLAKCHPDLQRLLNKVIEYYDIIILESYRGKKRQEDAFNSGNSKARFGESKHNKKPAEAVDLMSYPLDWENIGECYYMGGFVLGVASQMNIKIRWGGRFRNFFDGAHLELDND